MKTIRFLRYYVTDGTTKARVNYSLNNRHDSRKCVTLYAQDYKGNLALIFADPAIPREAWPVGTAHKNDTDSRSDYFDKGRTIIFEESPLYAQARAAAESAIAKRAARWQAVQAARQARKIAHYEVVEFWGKGDPYFGGAADDRVLGKSGVFLVGCHTVLDVARFTNRAAAESAAQAAPRRSGGRVGVIPCYGVAP